MPPGSAMKASARSPIMALRSCMVSTTCSSSHMAVGQFLVDQGLGDDADHAAAGRARGLGHRAHQAGAAAAVDQLAAAFADPAADRLRPRQ